MAAASVASCLGLGADSGMCQMVPTLPAIERQICQCFSRIKFILVVKQPTFSACCSCSITSEQYLVLHWTLQSTALVSGKEQDAE